jgi:hypothetical protein
MYGIPKNTSVMPVMAEMIGNEAREKKLDCKPAVESGG